MQWVTVPNLMVCPPVIVLLQVVKAKPGFVIQKSPLFPILLALSMAERLCAFAADIAVERDFVPQLAGTPHHPPVSTAGQIFFSHVIRYIVQALNLPGKPRQGSVTPPPPLLFPEAGCRSEAVLLH